MSMPQFPKVDEILTRDEAINAILTSIAMEEAALSHIINAEGEKIQYALQHMDKENCCKSMCMLLRVNYSVADLIDQITDLQLILKSKMRLAAGMVSEGNPCPDITEKPDKPNKPPPSPEPPSCPVIPKPPTPPCPNEPPPPKIPCAPLGLCQCKFCNPNKSGHP